MDILVREPNQLIVERSDFWICRLHRSSVLLVLWTLDEGHRWEVCVVQGRSRVVLLLSSCAASPSRWVQTCGHQLFEQSAFYKIFLSETQGS